MRHPDAFVRYVARMWRGKGLVSTLLLPLSWFYGGIIAVRKWQFRHRPAPRYRSPVPVIVVGNIYVGGTGKTPVVMAAVQALRQMGWQPGIVSRGYGVTIKGSPRIAHGDASAAWIGDEPALIAQATRAPIAVHPRRAWAVQALLDAHPEISIVVSDDGLQHVALERDVEIIVQDERGIGNGRLLPAGPLREPASRLQTADLIICRQDTGSKAAIENPDPATLAMQLQPIEARALASGRTVPWETWVARHQQSGNMAAVAGIGHPERFFRMLQAYGLTLSTTLALPDHGTITPALLGDIDADNILVTAKDAVKCHHIHDQRIWVVEVAAHFSRPDWLCRLLARKGIHPRAH
ncbi:MAG TPA: tetraacyldisaccharide 4'-kinase [Burkholderiaceae bacterium]|nr:tetraacyldisaccharide 4'-kinase [Burkholderiaceae bacterium]